uniref:Uncharacterized protein n=1 Tax=Arion vulgaris TaxID=1028688 RepID=A0A0B7BD25_9EUPU
MNRTVLAQIRNHNFWDARQEFNHLAKKTSDWHNSHGKPMLTTTQLGCVTPPACIADI